jgi:hypothetical protein
MVRTRRAVAWTLLVVMTVGIAVPAGAEEDPRIRAYQTQLDRMQ